MTGREVDPEARYRALQARMDAKAAERHAARQAAAVAAQEAVTPRTATAAEFEALCERLTEAVGQNRITEVAPSQAPVTESEPEPVKALHEMSPEEFRHHAGEVWGQHAESMRSPAWRPRPPMTLGEFLDLGRE